MILFEILQTAKAVENYLEDIRPGRRENKRLINEYISERLQEEINNVDSHSAASIKLYRRLLKFYQKNLEIGDSESSSSNASKSSE